MRAMKGSLPRKRKVLAQASAPYNHGDSSKECHKGVRVRQYPYGVRFIPRVLVPRTRYELPLGEYHTLEEAASVREVAAFYYGKKGASDFNIYKSINLPDIPPALSNEDKIQWVSKKAKECGKVMSSKPLTNSSTAITNIGFKERRPHTKSSTMSKCSTSITALRIYKKFLSHSNSIRVVITKRFVLVSTFDQGQRFDQMENPSENYVHQSPIHPYRSPRGSTQVWGTRASTHSQQVTEGFTLQCSDVSASRSRMRGLYDLSDKLCFPGLQLPMTTGPSNPRQNMQDVTRAGHEHFTTNPTNRIQSARSHLVTQWDATATHCVKYGSRREELGCPSSLPSSLRYYPELPNTAMFSGHDISTDQVNNGNADVGVSQFPVLSVEGGSLRVTSDPPLPLMPNDDSLDIQTSLDEVFNYGSEISADETLAMPSSDECLLDLPEITEGFALTPDGEGSTSELLPNMVFEENFETNPSNNRLGLSLVAGPPEERVEGVRDLSVWSDDAYWLNLLGDPAPVGPNMMQHMEDQAGLGNQQINSCALCFQPIPLYQVTD